LICLVVTVCTAVGFLLLEAEAEAEAAAAEEAVVEAGWVSWVSE
jgi:hypothetical protein